MRIDLTQAGASQIASEVNPNQVNARNDSVSVSAAHEDRTTLTSDQQSVSALVSAAMSSPEIRQDKVESLQQAIKNGSYQLDPGKIAESMLDEQA